MLRKAINARGYLRKAFLRYHREGYYKEENGGSSFIQRWTEHHLQHNLNDEQAANLQPGNAFAAVANTSATATWLVYYVFSNHLLLQACREELSKAVTITAEKDDGSIKTVCTLNIPYIKSSCHNLVAALQETLRVHGIGCTTRIVVEDEHLTDPDYPERRYLLKKGAVVFIPARVQHRLHSNGWGRGETDNPKSDDYDLDKFDHTRFLQKQGQKKERVRPGALRVFGGGATLCPGRHFATTEILAFVAMLVLRLDIQPNVGNGRWPKPTTWKSSLVEAVEQPDRDIDVVLSVREEAAGKEWRVSYEGSEEAGHARILVQDM